MIWLQSTLVIFDQCKDKDDQAVQTDLEMEANADLCTYILVQL